MTTTLARTTDPATSHQAVPSEGTLSHLRYLALLQFEKAGEDGLTADEVEVESRRKGIWRRCSDIKTGLIEPALNAEGQVRTRVGRSGKSGEVFKITQAGRDALEAAKQNPPKPRKAKRSQSKDQRLLEIIEEGMLEAESLRGFGTRQTVAERRPRDFVLEIKAVYFS